MNACTTHQKHSHKHGKNCDHTEVHHGGHIDYAHGGHLHHEHGHHVDEHSIEVTSANPDLCTKGHECSGHESSHQHGPTCGHEAIPHGDHVDYLVSGHLHHFHEGHCDNHGAVETTTRI